MKPAIAAVCMICGVLNACMTIDPEPNAPRVTNRTDEPVTLSINRGGVSTPLSTVNGGVTIYLNAFSGTCTDGTLVASGPDGQEVARRAEPLCTTDVWSIDR